MITLIYTSTSSFNCSAGELALFLNFVRSENIRLNITGILLYHEGEIMQIIEGEKEIIYELFEKIKVDKRHINVIKLNEFKIVKRAYEEWSMSFMQVSINDLVSVKGYLDLTDYESGLPKATDKSTYLRMLINSFKDENVKN